MCHLVLLLPLFGLPVFWIWPLSVAIPAYLVVLLLSFWMYYYVIAAIRRQISVGPETLLHSRGKVVRTDASRLRVRVQSEVWGASSPDRLVPGDSIEVVSIDGLTLHVKKALSG